MELYRAHTVCGTRADFIFGVLDCDAQPLS